jgi:hypothetical protein
VRFALVPASSVGKREKGVLGRNEKEMGGERERDILALIPSLHSVPFIVLHGNFPYTLFLYQFFSQSSFYSLNFSGVSSFFGFC